MDFPKRKGNRLAGWDYSQNGAYFVTVCTQHRVPLLSRIPVGGGFPAPQLTQEGHIVEQYIHSLTNKYPTVYVDKYVIMPNHIHVLFMVDSAQDGVAGDRAVRCGTGNPSPTMGAVMGWFKYQTTKYINKMNNTAGDRIWQRSFHDRIIRSEQEYQKIWQYMDTNPLKWEEDCFYITQ